MGGFAVPHAVQELQQATALAALANALGGARRRNVASSSALALG